MINKYWIVAVQQQVDGVIKFGEKQYGDQHSAQRRASEFARELLGSRTYIFELVGCYAPVNHPVEWISASTQTKLN